MKNLRNAVKRIVREELGRGRRGVMGEGVEYNDAVVMLGKAKKVLDRMLMDYDISIKKAGTHTYGVAPTGVFLYVTPISAKKKKAARVVYQDDAMGNAIFRVSILSGGERDVFTNYRPVLVSKDFSNIGGAVSYIVNNI